MNRQCTKCHTPLPKNHTTNLCTTCTTQLRDNLRSLAHDLPALRLIAAKQARITTGQTSKPNRDIAPIPISITAWTLLQDIETYARHTATAAGITTKHTTTETLLATAAQHTTTLAKRPDAAYIAAIASTATRYTAHHLNPPEPRTLIGHCPTCHIQLWCDTTDLASNWTVCPTCHTTLRIHDIQQTRILRLAASDTQGTATELAKLLRTCGITINANTIRQWKRRGKITPIALADGKPVYRLWDVWATLGQ